MALVASEHRAAAWCAVGASSLLVAVGGVVVHRDRAPLEIEVRIQDTVDAWTGSVEIWQSASGSVLPWAGLVVLLALMAWTVVRRWWRGMAACAAAPIAVLIAGHVLKPLVDRRDTGSVDLFYPSGHLTGVGAVLVLVLVLVLPSLGRAHARHALVALCVVAMGAALFVTIAGHGHGPLDAAAGLPTGAAIALAWVLLIDAACDALSPSRVAEAAP